MPARQVTLATVRGVVGSIPWALLLAFIIANSTIQDGSTDWSNVVRVSVIGLLPFALALGLSLWLPDLRSLRQGWAGVLVSWAVAFCSLVAVAWALGPFA